MISQNIQKSERRQATIMFADISGFTEISEKLDPEDVTNIMNQCFHILGEEINNFGGNIDKFIGDCIMAVFGVPNAIEHAPRQAILSALAMKERLKKFNNDNNLPFLLEIHIGINSGEVLYGTIGTGAKQELTVIGDAVNLASRLEDHSKSGEILVGPLTYHYTRTEFGFGELKPVTFKGKIEAVQVYKVLKTKNIIEQVTESENRILHSEIVGRSLEMKTLNIKIQNLISGKGSIVNIIGEAGIGKSRLCSEILHSTIEKVTVYEGRALSSGKNQSYYPIIDIIKNWIGVTEEDTQSQILLKLKKAIKATMPQHVDEIVPFIAILLGLTLHGTFKERMKNVSKDSLAQLISKKLRDLIIAISKIKPMILFIEDFHWVDESSLEMLRSMVSISQNNPVLFLFSFRPNYNKTSGLFHTEQLNRMPEIITDITLSSLSSEDCELLTTKLLRAEGIPNEIISQIILRSGGNPFFIEEIIRFFIDFGYFKLKDSGYIAIDDLDNVTVPNSINEVIMARVDSLDINAKTLLRIASVIGRSFFLCIITEIIKNEELIRNSLNTLKQLQFIRERTRMEEIEFTFNHVLAQEAVYNSVLQKERKELHEQVALAIEKVFSNKLHEFYGVLAMHYLQSENLNKAEIYLEKAGEEALKTSASSEALNYYRKVVTLYQNNNEKYKISPERMALLEKNIAISFSRKGDYHSAVRHCDLALNKLGCNTSRFRELLSAFLGIFTILKWIYFPLSKNKKIPDTRVKNIIEISFIKSWAISLIDSTEFTLFCLGVFRQILHYSDILVKKHFEMIVDIGSAISAVGFMKNIVKRYHLVSSKLAFDNHSYNLLRDSMLWLQFSNGLFSPEFSWELLHYFTDIGDFQRYNYNACFWGVILINRGNLDLALEIAKDMNNIGDDYQNPATLVLAYELFTLIYHEQHQYQLSIIYSKKLISLTEKLGQDSPLKLYKSHLARSLIDSGRLKEANKILEHVKNLLDDEKLMFAIQTAPAYSAIMAYYCRITDIKYNGTMPNNIRRQSRHFKNKLIKYGSLFAQRHAEAYRYAGIWFWQNGNTKNAVKHWDKGLQIAKELQMQPEIARIQFEIGFRMRSSANIKLIHNKNSTFYLEQALKGFEACSYQTEIIEIKKILD